MKYSICGPFGSHGEHLRWLLLLSKEFKILYYKNEQKNDFYNTYVYPEHRTCFNWLNFEFVYKERLDKIIHLSREIIKTEGSHKIISINVDPMYSYNNYLKFNPGLNTLTKEEFVSSMDNLVKNNTSYICNNNEEIFTIDGLKLDTPDLDKNLYNDLINFYEIEDAYDLANFWHKTWYRLHQKAKKQLLLEIPKEFDAVSFRWFEIRDFPNKPTNQHEYDIMLKSLYDEYNTGE